MSKENIRLFIAEDEAIILSSYKMILKKNGYSIVGTALNGQAALRGIIESKPDLILMDINMPKMSGIDVVKEVYKQCFIPCIFITAYYDQALLEMINDLGAFGYLVKPIGEKQLIVTVDIARNRADEFVKIKQEVEDTKIALDNRKIIERAKGIIMDNLGVKENEAMKFIQKKSRDKNIKLVEVAKNILKVSEVLD